MRSHWIVGIVFLLALARCAPAGKSAVGEPADVFPQGTGTGSSSLFPTSPGPSASDDPSLTPAMKQGLDTAKTGLDQMAQSADSSQQGPLNDASRNIGDWLGFFDALDRFTPANGPWLEKLYVDAQLHAEQTAAALEAAGLTAIARVFRELATKDLIYRIKYRDGRFIFARSLEDVANLTARADYSEVKFVMRLYKNKLGDYTRAIYRCYVTTTPTPLWLVDDGNCDNRTTAKVFLGYASVLDSASVRYPIYRLSHATRGDLITLSKASRDRLVAEKNGGWKDRGILGYTEN